MKAKLFSIVIFLSVALLALVFKTEKSVEPEKSIEPGKNIPYKNNTYSNFYTPDSVLVNELLNYGRHSIYELESVNMQTEESGRYTYRNRPDSVSSDFIEEYETRVIKGRYCSVEKNKAGYVVTGLKSHFEDKNYNTKYNFGTGTISRQWYIRPGIKIDSSGAYWNKKVCRIEVYNYDGDLVKKIEITGNNFLDEQMNFNTNYIDSYYRLSHNNNIIENGDMLNSQKKSNKKNPYCKTDIRVYWYGECNMWIDRITVEDEIAYNLLNPESALHLTYIKFLSEEKEKKAKMLSQKNN
jgi:hypothetical protein